MKVKQKNKIFSIKQLIQYLSCKHLVLKNSKQSYFLISCFLANPNKSVFKSVYLSNNNIFIKSEANKLLQNMIFFNNTIFQQAPNLSLLTEKSTEIMKAFSTIYKKKSKQHIMSLRFNNITKLIAGFEISWRNIFWNTLDKKRFKKTNLIINNLQILNWSKFFNSDSYLSLSDFLYIITSVFDCKLRSHYKFGDLKKTKTFIKLYSLYIFRSIKVVDLTQTSPNTVKQLNIKKLVKFYKNKDLFYKNKIKPYFCWENEKLKTNFSQYFKTVLFKCSSKEKHPFLLIMLKLKKKQIVQVLLLKCCMYIQSSLMLDKKTPQIFHSELNNLNMPIITTNYHRNWCKLRNSYIEFVIAENKYIKKQINLIISKTSSNCFIRILFEDRILTQQRMTMLDFPGDKRGKRRSLGLVRVLFQQALTSAQFDRCLDSGIYYLNVKVNSVLQYKSLFRYEGYNLLLKRYFKKIKYLTNNEVQIQLTGWCFNKNPVIGGTRKCRQRRKKKRIKPSVQRSINRQKRKSYLNQLYSLLNKH